MAGKMRFRIRFAVLTAPIATALAASPLVSQQTELPDVAAKRIAPGPQLVARIDAAIHPTVAPSPDSRFYAAIQTRPDPVLWIVPIDGSKPFAFRKMWAAYNARWSPSGNRIGFIAAIGPPRVWTVEVDPASGRAMDPPRLLVRTGANAFAFSPDGARIALVASRSTAAAASEIHIIDWETRQVRVLLRERGMIYRLDWSPDGRSIYYGLDTSSTTGASHEVKQVSLATGSAKAVRAVGQYVGLSPDGKALLAKPAEGDQGGDNLVEVVALNDGSVTTIELPPGLRSVGWAASSEALVLVAPADDKDGIWEIPIKAKGP
jgi:dipeptidyl aminopeptidase/acylaminoacyl peptidase